MRIPFTYLSPEGEAVVKARAKELGEQLAANRALRATAQTIDLYLTERRATNSGDRRTVDRRGLFTVEVEGQVVIRPAPGLGRFDAAAADVTAFRLDDAFRGGA